MTRLPDNAVIRAGPPRRGVAGRGAPLSPPGRVVGRDREIAALEAAVAAARAGGHRGLVVSGPGGVGTTALVDRLRSVADHGGWFVAGGYDRHRRDPAHHGVRQALRHLGRLLLAEPERERSALRHRLRRALGPRLDLAATVVPELATLLDLRPRPPSDDRLNRPARLHAAAVDLLRAVCSRQRPVVFAVDDLQWADATALGLLDRLLLGEPVEGLVTVAAYRTDELYPDSPLAASLPRWCHPGGPAHLRLAGLDTGDLAVLLRTALRLEADRAADLAALLAPYVAGNPLRALEVLDALRRDGLLTASGGRGWRWDPRAVRHRLATPRRTTDLVADRVASLPPATVEVLEAMACLGEKVELSLLGTAVGVGPADLRQRLAPAFRDGLLAPAGPEAVRFRHDVVRETVLRRTGTHDRRATRLALARRLADAGPGADADAAHLYLPVVDEVRDPAERRAVAGRFRRAAGQAELLGDHATVLGLLDAALPLVDPHDTATLADVHTRRHAALCGLGRLAEADAAFEAVQRLNVEPLSRVDATLAQIDSLASRGRHRDAVELGTHLLRRLGVATPGHERLDVEIERGLAAAYQWLAGPQASEPGEPVPPTPTTTAVAAVIDRMLPPAAVCDEPTHQWLALTALRMWAGRGPEADLVGPVSHLAGVLLARRQDHRAAHAALRRVLAISEARGYEPAASRAHLRYAMDVGHWFEPLDHSVAHCRRARDGLLAGGDPAAACASYLVSVTLLMEYAPGLDRYGDEVDAGLAFARRIGDDLAAAAFQGHRDLLDRLRGTGGPPADRPHVPVGRPGLAASHHLTRALGAALFDDPVELHRRTSALMPMARLLGSTYLAVQAHLLRALALAERVRTGPPAERGPAAAELDRVAGWLADRAEWAPANLRHLRHLVEAERAWAVGDVRAALAGFDSAVGQAAARPRPWHLAYALERAGRFHLAQGAAHTGATLLAQARDRYLRWGAAGKVAHLDRAHPGLAGTVAPPVRPTEGVPAGAAELSTLLASAHDLSTPTTPGGVQERVVEILSAMTGATHVHLLVRAPDGDWVPATGPATPDGPAAVPATVARHLERTGQPLVVDDATRDERFADDPHLAGLDRCSLLAVPVGDRDRADAVLVLENRHLAGAFTPGLRDTVSLIAAQAAISLQGARRYRDLERRMDERGAHLADATRRLARLDATDPLTGLANRRHLEQVLAQRWAEAQVTGEPMALAMIDIDSFKLYNDTYGHTAGDRRLQDVAAALRTTVRGGDLAARYGGEEFAVLMPRTDLRGASAAAERIRAAVADRCRRAADTVTPPITVSIGVAAAVPLPGEREHGLVELADGALHGAKRDGGDRVRWAPRPRP
ncbi:MAG TPA: diguanylate cyclase [Natronosporangium sp.]|nr:diguanylate cyclase [Natronosporangium sp.]